MIKICKTCNLEKPIEQFVKNKSSQDGYTSMCKPCRNIVMNSENRERAAIRISNKRKENLVKYVDKSEIWKDFPTDERYEVSNKGRIRNKTLYELLSPSGSGSGYLLFTRYKNGKFSGAYVHHAVAMAFIGNRPNRLTVSHLDGNKFNNCVENLKYESVTDNLARKFEHNTQPMGEDNQASKLSEYDVIEIRKLYSTGDTSYSKLANSYNVSTSTIYRVMNNICWSHVK